MVVYSKECCGKCPRGGQLSITGEEVQGRNRCKGDRVIVSKLWQASLLRVNTAQGMAKMRGFYTLSGSIVCPCGSAKIVCSV